MRRPDILKDSEKIRKIIADAKAERELSNHDIIVELQALGVKTISEPALSRYFNKAGSGSLSQMQVITLAAYFGIKIKLTFDSFSNRQDQQGYIERLVRLQND